MFNLGKVKISAINLYNAFMARCAAQTDEDHRRYLLLSEFLDMPNQEQPQQPTKTAADPVDPEQERGEYQRERKKTEQFVGQHGMNQAFSQAFINLIEDYLPGGYFWDENNKKIATDFYRMVYKGFSEILPKMISYKTSKINLKEVKKRNPEISDDKAKQESEQFFDIPENSIKLDPEAINRIITDALIYFSKNPEDLKEGLIKAFSRKSTEEESGKIGIGQVFFVPKKDASEPTEIQDDSDKSENRGFQDIDNNVIDNLEDRDFVKWTWKGLDENGTLSFTLPDLYGDRIFTVKLPADVKNIRPGTYTFKIKASKRKGVILDFVEQRNEMLDDTLESLDMAGFGVDQLKKFINNGIISKYNTVLRAKPIESLFEDLGGAVFISGHQIGSVNDLAELGDEDLRTQGARGKEKTEEARRKNLEKEHDKIKAVVDRWGPVLGKHFLQVRQDEGSRMAQAISAHFPERSDKKIPSLQSIQETRPVVQMVLSTIMSPATPLGSGNSDPWIYAVKNQFDRAAIENPILKEQIALLIHNQKAKQTKTPENVTQTYEPVDDAEIRQYVKNIPTSTWRMNLLRLRDEIKDIMQTKMRSDPALKKFFERRRTFNEYISKDLEDQVVTIMEEQKLDPTKAEDMKTLDKFMQEFINSTVKRMETPSSMSTEASLTPELFSSLMKQAYCIANSKR
jgi:hypothetical protein